MFDVKIPKEIKNYKEKIIAGLTKRQLLFVTLGLACGVTVYIYGNKYLGDDITSWLVILIVCCVVYFGLDIHGIPPEKYLVILVKKKLLYPSVRTFKRENAYERAIEEKYRELENRLYELENRGRRERKKGKKKRY